MQKGSSRNQTLAKNGGEMRSREEKRYKEIVERVPRVNIDISKNHFYFTRKNCLKIGVW